jgi:hypothetical protein
MSPYKNPELQKASQHAWYVAHKQLTRSRSIAWRLANPEKRKEQQRREQDKRRAKRIADRIVQ